MAIGREGQRASRLAVCRDAASIYLLTRAEADDAIDHTVQVLREQWADATDSARLTSRESGSLWGRQVLNPYVFEDA